MSSPTPERERVRIGWIPYLPNASTWRERVWNHSDIASVRVRCLAPSAALKAAGWSSEMFSADRPDDYDVVVFQKAYDTRSVELAVELKRRGVRVVLDVCDNHLYNPGARPDVAARARRLFQMLRLVDAVSVSTPALADLLADTPRPLFVVDDALDPLLRGTRLGSPRRSLTAPRRARDERLRVVWFGTQIANLRLIEPELRLVQSELPLELTVITNSRRAVRSFGKRARVRARYRRWTRSRFAAAVRQHDVCVIPVIKDPFTVVKTGNRVITSLLLGVPVVASRLPSYEEFSHCVLFEDWAKNLSRYARDRELAAAHVDAGQKHIRSKYTDERVVHQWSEVIESVFDAAPAVKM